MTKNLPFEFVQFLQEKIREHLPPTFSMVGGKYNGRCPFCGDSHKSLSKKRGWIYFSNDCSYYCFNCGTGMSGMKFLEAISGESYTDIRRDYAKLLFKNKYDGQLSSCFTQPIDEPTVFQMKNSVLPEWKNPLSEKAQRYLSSRKVNLAPFLKDPLFSCYSKKNEEYILIPWTINGVDAYYQLNDFQKLHSMKYIFPKSKKKLIAGLDNIDISWPYIIVFEGFYDSVFVKNGICVGTKAITDYQLSLIKDRYPNHQIVVSFDNDSSGLESMMKMIRQNQDFKYFKWFNQNTKEKDINEYVLSKNDVNIFADQKILERLIVDKLMMKMQLIQQGFWKSEQKHKHFNTQHDTSSFWKKRKVQFC